MANVQLEMEGGTQGEDCCAVFGGVVAEVAIGEGCRGGVRIDGAAVVKGVVVEQLAVTDGGGAVGMAAGTTGGAGVGSAEGVAVGVAITAGVGLGVGAGGGGEAWARGATAQTAAKTRRVRVRARPQRQ